MHGVILDTFLIFYTKTFISIFYTHRPHIEINLFNEIFTSHARYLQTKVTCQTCNADNNILLPTAHKKLQKVRYSLMKIIYR